MTNWESFAAQAPRLAAAVRARFTAHRHHVLATLRRDGSPRVSGTEVSFHGPDLVIGSMPGSVKARDLLRDGRFALHANPGDGSMTGGDAKVSGTAVEVTAPEELESFRRRTDVPPGPFHLFRLELRDAVLTSVEGDALVVDLWQAGSGVRRFTRR
ncbi:pyridoxamine 5'-phosphate oxidase family protein [Thermobifida cellulosilytica]|uniref:Pyridoxamine 5'-phosphate oxidase n=1 Tax=Thermobifida cellulosilytica TB100 TaxID=665004 RepID=A0A147KD51_THECS|nr:pyridoxamine 5'-phosphate oxidase family protein [Thermobifida cellulosilytica]KUP95234.1 pyridoxamine 5'-phosphate oxidase [Thermobifida cellulosilytica TB100]